MSKNKNKLYKILHPNRYFIWTLIFAIVSLLGLFSYIYISTLQFDAQNVFSNNRSYNTYTDYEKGFSAKYPLNWDLEYDNKGNIVFQNPANLEENITVTSADLDLEGIIRNSVSIKEEMHFTKPGFELSIMKAGSLKDDSDLDIALVKTKDKLYYIFGNSPVFSGFAHNFRPF